MGHDWTRTASFHMHQHGNVLMRLEEVKPNKKDKQTTPPTSFPEGDGSGLSYSCNMCFMDASDATVHILASSCHSSVNEL